MSGDYDEFLNGSDPETPFAARHGRSVGPDGHSSGRISTCSRTRAASEPSTAAKGGDAIPPARPIDTGTLSFRAMISSRARRQIWPRWSRRPG